MTKPGVTSTAKTNEIIVIGIVIIPKDINTKRMLYLVRICLSMVSTVVKIILNKTMLDKSYSANAR